ncbi:MAG TPA: NAD(P)H-hydrate dehydratase [Puia sp.]|jgi:NAD(P)H-hydrate epimerase|nr:NAD(P)H-hydrate dehydratase [Puia sp.]
MQIFSAEQIRKWDEFTIQHEMISSIELMERAAEKCFEWFRDNGNLERSFSIFCGKGNNGGDGLAIARMLSVEGCNVVVYILEFGHKGTQDFQINLALLHETSVEIRFIQTEKNFHPIPENDIIIDALFGSGLNRPPEGITADLIEYINGSGNEIIAVDIPSGLSADNNSTGNIIIHATHTLSFQCWKLAFLLPQNELFTGEIHILDIGLHPDYPTQVESDLVLVDKKMILSVFKPRKKFANKGNFGHALLLAGSHGKMGAAILASKACLGSGAGLLTTHVPKCGYEIMQVSIPEAMIVTDDDENINTNISEDISKYNAVGVGPGIGTDYKTSSLLESLLKQNKKPMVIDADALNIMSANNKLLSALPPYSILTPHPKEFERLFGRSENDFEKLQLALQKAKEYQCLIVLKGHYTFIATPSGKGYFNSTGNAGMAKGGSGDALTGMLTGFLAQNYLPEDAAILGVYIHGLAGDFAATNYSQQSMLASDIINNIGQAFFSILKK